MIKENLSRINSKIKEICDKSSIEDSQVKLIAVSKTMPCEDILKAYEAGHRIFGENRVQEILDKYDKLPKDIEWHMIGHLQSNKIKYIIDKVKLVHSLDSMKLASCIEKEAAKANTEVHALLQVNVANEETKFGFTIDELLKNIEKFSEYKFLKIKGLMTVAPNVDNPEKNREIFKKLKQLSVDIKSKSIDNITMDCLSMGMTGDYPVAIEEGATYIRVGTAIFGVR